MALPAADNSTLTPILTCSSRGCGLGVGKYLRRDKSTTTEHSRRHRNCYFFHSNFISNIIGVASGSNQKSFATIGTSSALAVILIGP